MSEREKAVFVISVAADLAGVHPQTLRIYERKGLLSPQRTAGNTRRYSQADIDRLQRIQELTQDDGVNLSGVKRILELEGQIAKLRGEIDRMGRRLEGLESDLEEHRSASRSAEIQPAAQLQALVDMWMRRERAPRDG